MPYRKRHIKSKIHKIRLQKSIFKMPIFWILNLVVVIVLSVLYFLIFFSGFQVENIIISGNEKIPSKNIEKLAYANINKKIIGIGKLNLMSKSIFLVNSQKLQQEILSRFPVAEAVAVEKKLPQTISLKITEKKPVAIFCSSAGSEQASAKCFFIDKNGVIFEELQSLAQRQDMPIITQTLNSNDIFTGESVVDRNVISAISKIEKNLKDNFQIDIKEALVSNPLRLDIKTNENWQIYFDLNSDTNLQIIKLNSLLKNEISQTSRASLQYIDLRFKDRAYYK